MQTPTSSKNEDKHRELAIKITEIINNERVDVALSVLANKVGELMGHLIMNQIGTMQEVDTFVRSNIENGCNATVLRICSKDRVVH